MAAPPLNECNFTFVVMQQIEYGSDTAPEIVLRSCLFYSKMQKIYTKNKDSVL